ncbi:hypothetical protein AYO44_00245 [Planctomycetaceae bacterium SCGC AG-212-F19]|nr:hypothetical protein AYO44_00245 [Planctomycetaceae bacterium SCGC AG-212-F19]
MKQSPVLVAVAVLLVAALTICGHAAVQDAVKALMAKKLENAHKVMDGIALGDFDKIGKHADELIRVSKAVEFRVLKTPQYEVYSNDFRRNAETLGQMATAKNLDGAALAYVELTLSCVKCHKHVREVRMARAD